MDSRPDSPLWFACIFFSSYILSEDETEVYRYVLIPQDNDIPLFIW